ncbi:MAG: potassium/proton antiporter [Dysgonamonadaceae bacterium]|jgi:cell volume regulation protein A|nr:potassium/proton antiporter [Dysgonamonadaceae bacterium]MDD3355953.1 potassium/proton antiporter [Dysgonamonadaceae bacterium]MDD3726834.1 potassium/proton antiporter [Dysgonamonadaceae bacterium]MDD4246300.1 potassium/proton antiporter [Dysgonamonadaceae bacterium]MDD4605395.1 potassium/proton antiporter [Dysgonamonadaceae bacterium]
MSISIELILLISSVLFFVSMVVGKAGHKFGIPVLLLFLGVGMLFGQDGFGLQFHNIQTAQIIGTIALSIILFSGGLDTKFLEIQPIIYPGVVLATGGVVLTALFTGVFIWWLSHALIPSLGIGMLTALLLASTTSSTDSASVFGILRSRGTVLKNNLRPLLELESGSNDPMAYMLTVTFITIINAGGVNFWQVSLLIIVQLVVGALAGYYLGKLSVILINRIRLDNSALYPILLFTFGMFIFSLTYFLQGNGYLAIYIAGLVIGNSKFVHKRTSMRFMDGLAWMSQIILFLTLGLLVNPLELLSANVLVPGLIISAFIIVIARPVTVFLTLIPFKRISLRDKTFISWVGLRGAVPIIFAILTLAADVPHARWIFNIVFIITLVSLILQGTFLNWVASWLKLSQHPVQYRSLEDFDVEFAEEIKSAMTEILITDDAIKHGKNLMEMSLPDKTLAVMVKRGEKYFIPTGQTELKVGDKLLVISDDEHALKATYKSMGISEFSYHKNK